MSRLKFQPEENKIILTSQQIIGKRKSEAQLDIIAEKKRFEEFFPDAGK